MDKEKAPAGAFFYTKFRVLKSVRGRSRQNRASHKQESFLMLLRVLETVYRAQQQAHCILGQVDQDRQVVHFQKKQSEDCSLNLEVF